MPFPALLVPIIGGIVAASGVGYGAKRAYDGYTATKDAKDYFEWGQSHIDNGKKALTDSRDAANQYFYDLGKVKQNIIKTSYERFLKIYDLINMKNCETLPNFQNFKNSINSLNTEIGEFKNAIIAAGSAGAAATFGFLGVSGGLASAITGFSGVCATNAALAMLGGGSLAAGGGGMALGTAVLGGVIAAPAVLLGGIIFANMSESKRAEAKIFYNWCCAAEESNKAEALAWDHIRNQTFEKQIALSKTDKSFCEAMDKVEYIINTEGVMFSTWQESSRKKFITMVNIGHDIADIIKKPAVSDDDPLLQEIKTHSDKANELVKKINDKFGN